MPAPLAQFAAVFGVVFIPAAIVAIDLESPRLGHDALFLTAEILEEIEARNSLNAGATASTVVQGGLMRRESPGPSSLAALEISVDGRPSNAAAAAAAPSRGRGRTASAPRMPAALGRMMHQHQHQHHARHDASTASTSTTSPSPEPVEYEMIIECDNCGECAWGGADTSGNRTGSLDGAGHTEEECRAACLESPTCHYAAIGTSGYCHMFEVCNAPTPEGDKKRWAKQAKLLTGAEQVMVLDCDGCGECAWSTADHTGQASLGGNNHSAEECQQGCLASESCQFAARSPTGYCHMFSSCSQASPEGDKVRWRKQAASMGEHKAASSPKTEPDSWHSAAGTTASGDTSSSTDNATLELNAKAQAEFSADELDKVTRRAGIDAVEAQATTGESQANPHDSDIDTKEELLALYGIAAICVLCCSACVYRRIYSEEKEQEKVPLQGMRVDGLVSSEGSR